MALVWHGKVAREVRENPSGFFVRKIFAPMQSPVRSNHKMIAAGTNPAA